MSDTSQGPGWWQAADFKWYPPQVLPMPPHEIVSGQLVDNEYGGPSGPVAPHKKSNRGCIIAVVVTLVAVLVLIGALVLAAIWGLNKLKTSAESAVEDSVIGGNPFGVNPFGDNPLGEAPNSEGPLNGNPFGGGFSSGSGDVKITSCRMVSANPNTPGQGSRPGPEAILSITNSTDKPASYVITVEFVAKDGTGNLATGIAATENLPPGQTTTTKAFSLFGGQTHTKPFDCKVGRSLRTAGSAN